MKPFNLEEAKAGKPVCNRDGNDVRIICFDSRNNSNNPIVALHTEGDIEEIFFHDINGKSQYFSRFDLFMKSEKKEGWVNIYKDSCGTYRNSILIHPSKGDAIIERQYISNYIDTVKVEWEE